MSSKPPFDIFTPRGFAPRTPRHALSRAASSARSVRVARVAPLARFFLRPPQLVRTRFQRRQQLLMNVIEAAVRHNDYQITGARLLTDCANDVRDFGDIP